jgi:hypothetical protein
MSRIVWPSIAATCVALYFFSRKRKADDEFEIEPVDDIDFDSDASLADVVALAAE